MKQNGPCYFQLIPRKFPGQGAVIQYGRTKSPINLWTAHRYHTCFIVWLSSLQHMDSILTHQQGAYFAAFVFWTILIPSWNAAQNISKNRIHEVISFICVSQCGEPRPTLACERLSPFEDAPHVLPVNLFTCEMIPTGVFEAFHNIPSLLAAPSRLNINMSLA